MESKGKKLYVLVEFPYPSGSGLHVGHMFTYVGADCFARFKRAQGFNVLFPMGWDAFGLPAENYAIKTGRKPQITVAENIKEFKGAMESVLCSFDWAREVSTTDPNYYRWTQWIFIQLFKHGLAYKEKMPINWCSSCKIGLANEEVVAGKCERCGAEVSRKELNQWIVKITDYADRLIDGLENTDFIEKVKAAQINWIGKSSGSRVKFLIKDILLRSKETGSTPLYLEVFTTRPDTLYGATFMVVSPEHWLVDEIIRGNVVPSEAPMLRGGVEESLSSEKLREIEKYIQNARKKSDLERAELQKEKTGVFSGLYAINPVIKKEIPIWISDFVLASYGTGAIMSVPAHDERDFAFAKKFNLPITPVIKPKDKDWDFTKAPFVDVDNGISVNSDMINGLPSKEAIEKMIVWLEEKEIGRRAASYHLRDWIFSRQHYWGEPIPMVYCESCAKKGIVWRETEEGKKFLDKFQKIGNWKLEIGNSNRRLAGWFPLDENELPLKLPEVEKYQPTDTGESPLSAIKEFVETKCPHCGGPAKRETDTMPNWAGSDWYYLAYVFADKLNVKIQNSNVKAKFQNLNLGTKNEKILNLECKNSQNIFTENENVLRYWLPVDIYIGGDEHNTLHLLYSRFIYQFLWDIGVVPKEHPEPYFKRVSHGVMLGPDGRRMSKSKGNVVLLTDALEKYGADGLRMALMFLGPYEATMNWSDEVAMGVKRFLAKFEKMIKTQELKNSKKNSSESEKEIKVLINKLIKKMTSDLENLQFNTAIAAMMETINNLRIKNLDLRIEEKKILVKLISPFAPQLAEKLWSFLFSAKSYKLEAKSLFCWPKPDPKYLIEDKVELVIQINGKVKGRLEIEREKSEEEIVAICQKDPKISAALAGKKIIKTFFVPCKLINFVVL